MTNLKIGEVAALFEITPKTIRHYEKYALLNPSRNASGYREYTPQDVMRIQRIRQLQALGLTLKQVQQILDQQAAEAWQAVLAALLDDTQAAIANLQKRQARLLKLLDDEDSEMEMVDAVALNFDEVNAYLETHLSAENRAQWQQNQSIFASLDAAQHGLPLVETFFHTVGVVANPTPLPSMQPAAHPIYKLPSYILGDIA